MSSSVHENVTIVGDWDNDGEWSQRSTFELPFCLVSKNPCCLPCEATLPVSSLVESFCVKEMWTAVLCSLLVAIVTRFLWRRWRYDLHKVPTPPGWPILGHTPDFVNGGGLRNLAKWIGQRLKRLGYPKLMRVLMFVVSMRSTK